MPRRRRTAALLRATLLGATLLAAGCAPGAGVADRTDGTDRTLAKMDGWRGPLTHDAPFAVLEIAYDLQTARTMWDENVDEDLPALEGSPREPGVYGDLQGVDFSDEVVGLFSSGESGSCPGWVRDVELDDDGTVAITRTEDLQGGTGCTDDYRPYRVLIVIDRNDVPDPDSSGTAHGVVDGNEVLEAVVGEYPVTP